MQRRRLLFFVLLFLALTALRLGVPEWPEKLRGELWAAIGQTQDYRAMTEAMGRNLSSESFREGLIAVLRPGSGQDMKAEPEEEPAILAVQEENEEAEPVSGVESQDASARREET